MKRLLIFLSAFLVTLVIFNYFFSPSPSFVFETIKPEIISIIKP